MQNIVLYSAVLFEPSRGAINKKNNTKNTKFWELQVIWGRTHNEKYQISYRRRQLTEHQRTRLNAEFRAIFSNAVRTKLPWHNKKNMTKNKFLELQLLIGRTRHENSIIFLRKRHPTELQRTPFDAQFRALHSGSARTKPRCHKENENHEKQNFENCKWFEVALASKIPKFVPPKKKSTEPPGTLFDAEFGALFSGAISTEPWRAKQKKNTKNAKFYETSVRKNAKWEREFPNFSPNESPHRASQQATRCRISRSIQWWCQNEVPVP